MTLPPAIIIAGPTASGKSGLAVAVARAFNGTVINADSMQVYAGLRVLTAGPSAEDEAQIPHRLYGCLPPSAACSAARWRDLAAAAMAEAWDNNRLPVVVGGTGLYLRTLMDGLSPLPDIDEAVRYEARALLAELGNAAFHACLADRDPVMAARLERGDSQRLVRAWEVLQATGRSLADWQAQAPEGAVAARYCPVIVLPPRPVLYAACDGRFRRMVKDGALDEVRALMAQSLDPALPATRALGVAELAAFVREEITLDAAIDRATQATRNYAKRQITWFRHQIPGAEQFSESLPEEIFPFIRRFLLTEA
jgi:tRNA dimethylallyltransferase